MKKPPEDLDRDKFVFGDGLYDNLETAQPFCDGKFFRIEPAPMPLVGTFVLCLTIIAFCVGFHFAVKLLSNNEAGVMSLYVMPTALAVFTCGLICGIFCYRYSSEHRRGPWLVYDLYSQKVELPREKQNFNRDEIVHLQYVSTKRRSGGDCVSELNLVTCRNGEQQRWPLLRSIAGRGAFRKVLKGVEEHTDFEVMRVKDQLVGWKITERPMFGRKPKT